MKFPDKLDVLTIQATLIADTGGTSGLRDEGAFESALAAAENRHHYEGADAVSCAATYAYHKHMRSSTATNASVPRLQKHSSKRTAIS